MAGFFMAKRPRQNVVAQNRRSGGYTTRQKFGILEKFDVISAALVG